MGKPQIRLDKEAARLAQKSAVINRRSLPAEVNRVIVETLTRELAHKLAVKESP